MFTYRDLYFFLDGKCLFETSRMWQKKHQFMFGMVCDFKKFVLFGYSVLNEGLIDVASTGESLLKRWMEVTLKRFGSDALLSLQMFGWKEMHL